jgi:glyoxylase-like metal-dependent hydrolase (beta-lactamase superfamily II)
MWRGSCNGLLLHQAAVHPLKHSRNDNATLTAEGQGFTTPEPRLQYVAEPTPGPGGTVMIAPGIHWLRMPMPLDLDHINLWLIEDGDGYTLIDTGLAAAMCTAVWATLEAVLLRSRPLRRILLTHFHPDHIGCAAWLQQRHGVPVRIAARALAPARLLIEGAGAAERAAMVAYFTAHGMPEAEAFVHRLASIRTRSPASGMPRIDAPLVAGEVVAAGSWRFEVIETDGHATAHHSFYSGSPGLLISGDQVLPNISPNISLGVTDWGQDPLGEYLNSLDRLEALPEHTLVLPSHGRPFRGLRARTADLRAHHHEHLALLREQLSAPQSAFALLPVQFGRRLAGLHLMLGLLECVAHLEHLVRRGEALRQSAPDGAFRYSRA